MAWDGRGGASGKTNLSDKKIGGGGEDGKAAGEKNDNVTFIGMSLEELQVMTNLDEMASICDQDLDFSQ